jgi:hypothetical protein
MKKMRMGIVTVMVVSAVVSFLSLHAAVAEETAEHAGARHYHRHHVGLFLGNTQDGGEHGFTGSLDYEYRLHELFGIGVLAEYAAGDFENWVFGVPLILHPYKGWTLKLVPGVEYEEETDTSEFLVRTGIAYVFEISDRWTLAPEFSVDFVDEKTQLVYGVSIGLGF